MKFTYTPPDFVAIERELRQRHALRDAAFLAAPLDGVAPERFYTTTNDPTYVRLGGRWHLVQRARIDCAVALDLTTGALVCVEPRDIRCGDPVLVGQAPLAEGELAWQKHISQTGEEGIYVHTTGFVPETPEQTGTEEPFAFIPNADAPEYEAEYGDIAALIEEHRNSNGGLSIWVLGPAVVHSSGRKAMQWLIERGYVGAIFGGNGVATHDIEKAILGAPPNRGAQDGHRCHIAVLNMVRQLGSIRAAIEAGLIQDGIMYACYKHNIPFVLAGSIRDDGPLPEVITDSIAAQHAMRELALNATLGVMLVSVLHAIAASTMLPVYIERNGTIAPIELIAVDGNRSAVTKLLDRGTHQAHGIVRSTGEFLGSLIETLQQRQSVLRGCEMLDLAETARAQRAAVLQVGK